MSNDKLTEIIRSLGYTTQRQTAEIVAAIRAHEAEKQAGPVAEPVGEAVSMPGTSGFTMACFKSADVPIGTKLYTAPPSPLTEQDKEDAERYRCLKEMVSGSPMEGSYFFPGVDAWGGDVPRHSLSVDQAVDAIRAARAKKEQT